ncbi:hypothetical protein HII36_48520 [Nonomuraea sp. NN258]|uniref:hypothetical protein n=1 Tax=Nonomuraea antri TaxID=2730852 RepID=UPI001568F52A|nr:hypothetical protein [Nonomuraea antri]NRQ39625.1 hypothetical protein [Nonomuraea antri]
MSFEEKRVWIYAAIAVGVPVVYFAIVLGQLPTTPVTEIAYVRPLLVAIGAAMVMNIGANIVAGILSPQDAGQRDERDADIVLYGRRVEFYVLSLGALAAFGLTLLGSAHFWIANALYLGFVLSAFVSSVAKIVAYRRGF